LEGHGEGEEGKEAGEKERERGKKEKDVWDAAEEKDGREGEEKREEGTTWPVKAHSSEYRMLHACNCGKTRTIREDPFDLKVCRERKYMEEGGWRRRREEEGGRRKEEGGRRKEEGGRSVRVRGGGGWREQEGGVSGGSKKDVGRGRAGRTPEVYNETR
jgi:hypothetical protein